MLQHVAAPFYSWTKLAGKLWELEDGTIDRHYSIKIINGLSPPYLGELVQVELGIKQAMDYVDQTILSCPCVEH